jgi:putative peptide zinc metalloprotease protein
MAAVAVLLARPGIVPGHRDLIWSRYAGVVLLGNAALGWATIGLHELAHLLVARAAGVPGRISIGTRLQFLVAQTDVSGIWSSPRRARVAVYSAGMVLDLVIAGIAVLVRAAVPAGSVPFHVLGALALLTLWSVALQLLVLMRSDVYFLLQDLARCRDLYHDGGRFLLYLGRRLRAGSAAEADPSAALPAGERRAVRAYAVFLGVRTACCLGYAATVTLPAAATLLADRLTALGGAGATRADRLDALATVTCGVICVAVWTGGVVVATRRRHPPPDRAGRAGPPTVEGGDPMTKKIVIRKLDRIETTAQCAMN